MTERRRPVVCVLAYNEEARIASVIEKIIVGNADTRPRVRVYANGCTDRTHEIVESLARENPQVDLRVLDKASKPAAWNQAFRENSAEILLFADADVTPEPGAVAAIHEAFLDDPSLELACCESWPDFEGANFQQRVTGWIQIPLRQDFLIGHFYGIRRSAFEKHFARLAIDGLPEGIAGDDAFLDRLVARQHFRLVKKRVYYQPPVFDDYFRYLGRIRWQNEQIHQFDSVRGLPVPSRSATGRLTGLGEKLRGGSPKRLLLGVVTTLLRQGFKQLNRRRIDAAYRAIGPVRANGAWVLSQATRSSSVK